MANLSSQNDFSIAGSYKNPQLSKLPLGHESVESVQMYLHADMAIKEQALAKLTPAKILGARYRPDDHLLAFLKSL